MKISAESAPVRWYMLSSLDGGLFGRCGFRTLLFLCRDAAHLTILSPASVVPLQTRPPYSGLLGCFSRQSPNPEPGDRLRSFVPTPHGDSQACDTCIRSAWCRRRGTRLTENHAVRLLTMSIFSSISGDARRAPVSCLLGITGTNLDLRISAFLIFLSICGGQRSVNDCEPHLGPCADNPMQENSRSGTGGIPNTDSSAIHHSATPITTHPAQSRRVAPSSRRVHFASQRARGGGLPRDHTRP